MRCCLLAILLCLIAYGARAAPCGASPPETYRSFRDTRLGVDGEYPPSVFPNSQEDGGGRKFTSPDVACRFHVTTGENQLSAGAKDIERLSEQYYREKGISVAYGRAGDRWYVVSGTDGNDIFYEKGVLSRDGKRIAVLLIEYPAPLRSFFDPIVARMSHSFWTIR
jgi:serine/threonine-protein kinase